MVNRQQLPTSTRPKRSATVQTLLRFKSSPLSLWRGYTALASRNLPFTALQFPLFEHLKKLLTAHRESVRRRSDTGYGKQKGGKGLSLIEHGLVTAVSAGLAGSVAAWITTPIDVVKTRVMLAAGEEGARKAEEIAREPQQTQMNGKVKMAIADKAKESLRAGKDGLKDALGGTGVQHRKRKGSWQIGREIVSENGMKGLFRGGALRAVWTMIGSGLYLGVYESGRIYLARRRGETIDDDQFL